MKGFQKKKGFLGTIGALLLVLGVLSGILPGDGQVIGQDAASTAVQTVTQAPEAAAEKTAKPTATPKATKKPTPTPKAGPIIEPQDIADYLFEHGRLPDNFITKAEAQALGWDSRENYVSDVAPGKSIGGDRFGNREGLLPKAKGRQYYEADCYYVSGPRNQYRIVYSNDGLVYYTDDHYETFKKMKPSKK